MGGRFVQMLREGQLKQMLQELGWIYHYAKRCWGKILLYLLLGLAGTGLGLGASLISRDLTGAVLEPGSPWDQILRLEGSLLDWGWPPLS